MSEAYKSNRRPGPRRTRGRAVPPAGGGTPAQGRELRAQGRKTMRKLLDAGMRVFAERGYHAARVDDIVRAARASHGTFYLYFTNKQDLLRALAIECADELDHLVDDLGAIGPDADGYANLREFLEAFLTTYRRYGPVIRAWMEEHVEDPEVNRFGVHAFMDIAVTLGERMRAAGARAGNAEIGAIMALLERFAYYLVSRRLDLDEDEMLETLTTAIHRGFFGAPAGAGRTGPRR